MSYAVSASGWMEGTAFEQWFLKYFIPWSSKFQKPGLLFLDSHDSHMTFKTVESAKLNDFIMICLLPHTSHTLQPCDVALF